MNRRFTFATLVGAFVAQALTPTGSPAQSQPASPAEVTLELTPLGPINVQAGRVISTANTPILFSPDGRRAAFVTQQGSRQAAIVDGHEGPAFSRILNVAPGERTSGRADPVRFSADSQSFTYVGDQGGEEQVVITDGKPGPAYDQILWWRYAPVGHRVAYAARKLPPELKAKTGPGPSGPTERVAAVTVVVDGQPGPAFHLIRDFLFSPDGKRFAYVGGTLIEGEAGRARWEYQAVVDGQLGPRYGGTNGVTGLSFSPDGSLVTYIARKEPTAPPKDRQLFPQTHVVINGQEGPAYWTVYAVSGGMAIDPVSGGTTLPNPATPVGLFSADGKHYAYVAAKELGTDPKAPTYKRPRSQVLVIDGREVARHETSSGNAEITPTLSPDGSRYAYVYRDVGTGRSQHRYFVYIDGQKSIDYDEAHAVVFSPDGRHYAYVARNAGKVVVVHDGRELGPYDNVANNHLVFSPDSDRLAFVGMLRNRSFVVVDGEPGEAYRLVDHESLHFTEDSKQVVYHAGDETNQRFTVVDRQRLGAGAVFSADRGRVAHLQADRVGGSSQQTRIVVDGQPVGPAYHTVSLLQFSPDGRRFAAAGMHVVTSGTGKKGWHLVIDGQETPASHRIEQVRFSPDSRHLAWIVETDERLGGSSARAHQVLVDGQSIAAFARVLVQASEQASGGVAYSSGGLDFLPDGTLQFFAARDQTLYRVGFSPASMAALPPVDAGTDAQPGWRVVKAFEPHSKEAGEPRHLTVAKDGTLFAAAARGGKYQQGFVFRINADGSDERVLHSFLGNREDGSQPNALMVGPDGALYGTLAEGGQHGAGSLYRVEADGSGFRVLRHFERSRDGYGRTALLGIDADGTLYGGPVFNAMANSPGPIWRMKADGSDFAVVYQPVDPQAAWAQRQKKVAELTGLIAALGAQTHPTAEQRQQLAQAKAQLEELRAQENQPPAVVGPMIDGRDGHFYGVANNVIFRLTKDGGRYTVLHQFEGRPRDGAGASTPPVLGSDGRLYGRTERGGIADKGVLYKLERDGSSYEVILNPEQPLPFGEPIVGPDGALYAIGTGEGHSGRRIYRIDSSTGEFATLGDFEVKVSNARTGDLQFQDGGLFGLMIWGNGGGQVFRYVLPAAGTTADARTGLAVREVERQPPPLVIPADAFTPASAHFGAALASPATATVAQTQPPPTESIADAAVAPDSTDGTDEESNEEEEDEPLTAVEKARKAAEKAKQTTDKIKEATKKLRWPFGN